jgi:hypothetical protein
MYALRRMGIDWFGLIRKCSVQCDNGNVGYRRRMALQCDPQQQPDDQVEPYQYVVRARHASVSVGHGRLFTAHFR